MPPYPYSLQERGQLNLDGKNQGTDPNIGSNAVGRCCWPTALTFFI